MVPFQEDIAHVRVPVYAFVVELGYPVVWNVLTTLVAVEVPPTVVPLRTDKTDQTLYCVTVHVSNPEPWESVWVLVTVVWKEVPPI